MRKVLSVRKALLGAIGLTVVFGARALAFDLAVLDIVPSKDLPAVDENIQVVVRVKCRTGPSAATQLQLYSGRPHSAYTHALAMRKSRLIGAVTVPALTAGQTMNFSFPFVATDEFHNLFAWVDQDGTSGDAYKFNNTAIKRLRPEGGKDVSLRMCHVLYPNVENRTLTQTEITQQIAVTKAYAEQMWAMTLCMRMTVDVVVINRRLQKADFEPWDTSYEWLPPEKIKGDLLAQGVDIQNGSVYKMYFVHATADPAGMVGYNFGGLGYYRQDLSNGIPYGFFPMWNYFSTNPAAAALVHEGHHGIQNNLAKAGVVAFDRTHIDSTHWDLYLTLRDDNTHPAFEDWSPADDEFGQWMFETLPTKDWAKLGGNVTLTPHLSNQFNGGSGFLSDWVVLGPLDNAAVVEEGGNTPYIGKEEADRMWSRTQRFPQQLGWNCVGVNLDDVLERGVNNTNVKAYAFSNLVSPVSQQVQLRVGNEGGIRVWLNGSLVIDKDSDFTSATPDRHIATVTLNSGTNRLMVKCRNDLGGWGFGLRLTDTAGAAITNVTVTLPNDTQNQSPLIDSSPTAMPNPTNIK